MAEFKPYPSIPRIYSKVRVTEKIHGTNAQIYIEGNEMYCGSRNRWLTPEDDNAGFCNFCLPQKDEIIACLGEGRHFGEWYGNGIQSGYGLKEKRFALFVPQKDLLPWMDRVPVIYKGVYSDNLIKKLMEKLKENGSYISPGFMAPEGIVVDFLDLGSKAKFTFEKEDVPWSGIKKIKVKPEIDEEKVAGYLHPVRLEKLFGRDEKYMRDYPESLPIICKDYIADLIKETDFNLEEESFQKIVKSQAFKFIRLFVGNGDL